MANTSKTLSSRIAWTALLPNLGVRLPPVVILPQTVCCPLCEHESLTVLDDAVLGGAWVSCHGCGFSGDLIELAAAVWQGDVRSAVAKLEHLGLFADPVADEHVETYVRDHVTYRRRLLEFWDHARLEPMQQANASIRDLLRKFGLLQAANSPMWPDRAGRFVGAANRREVEELFAPLSHARQDRTNPKGNRTTRRGGGPGDRRLFHGHGWEDVLVVPYYDLPGRICGFLFIGREADPEAGDYVYKRANLGPSNLRVREAGVAMLSAIDDGPDQRFGDVVFLVTDPVVGLLLQTQKLRDSNQALPLVLAHFSQGIQTLRLSPELANRKIIFWGAHPRLFHHAKRHDGLLSRYAVSANEVARRLNHRRPADWLRLVKERAVPWFVKLRQDLQDLSPASIAEFLRRMEVTPEEMRTLLQGVGGDLRDRLEQCDPDRPGLRRVIVSDKTIIETDSGWEIEGSGEQLCNLPIRIELVATTDDGDCFYRGSVARRDRDTQFTVRKSDVDQRGLFKCVGDALLRQDAGFLNFQPKWSRQAAYIALQLRPPQYVTGVNRIGWRPKERCFQFPWFAIALGGELSDEPAVLMALEDAPASHLKPPCEFSRRDLAVLSIKSSGTELVWALAACIAHNLIAATWTGNKCGIILDGKPTAEPGQTAARALGCAELNVRNRSRRETVLEHINTACCRHDWPAILEFGTGATNRVTSQWLDDPGVYQAILSLDGYAAAAVASYPGFLRIQATAPAIPLGELRRAARSLIPAWLQDACKRNLLIDQAAEHEVYNVLLDMAEWFERVGGDPSAVLAARTVLHVDSLSLASSFVAVVARLHEMGEVDAVRKGFRSSRDKLPAIVSGDTAENGRAAVWVPARVINQTLARRRVPALNLASVEQALHDEENWLGERVYDGVQGWLLDEGWWGSQLEEIRRREPGDK